MTLPSFLSKQYGPFNGITWVGVVGGGAVLAYFLRKSFSGGSKQPAEQQRDTGADLGLPGTTYRRDGSGPSGDAPSPAQPVPAKPAPVPAKPAPVPAKPAPRPVPLPEKPREPLPGPVMELPKKKNPTPAPKQPAPKQPAPQKPQADIPGGFPADCTGVTTPRGTATSVLQVYRDKRAAGLGDRMARDIANQTAFMGIANIPGLGQTSIAVFLQNKGNWPSVNRNRRNRGLRALTSTELGALMDMQNTMTAQNAGKSLTDAQLQQVWSTFHDGFTCENRPANSGSRQTTQIRKS